MKTAAIIAEYNPFHNGHGYHIEKTREAGCQYVFAVMSGNYVQRGSPAIADKWTRAAAAVAGGVDLVLELPLPWSMAAAETFARGGIQVINATGIAEYLSFGCECGSLSALERAAEATQTTAFQQQLQMHLSEGKSYPRAVGESVADPQLQNILRAPNNTLALEYLRQLQNTALKPLPILRAHAHHDTLQPEGLFASAGMLRELYYKKYNTEKVLYEPFAFCPAASLLCYRQAFSEQMFPLLTERFQFACLSRLRQLSVAELRSVPDMSEGLENRIYTAIHDGITLDEVCLYAKSKRYTHARIRRILLAAALGLRAQIASEPVPYIRVLALNSKGRALLRTMRETATLPIFMRHADLASLDARGKDLIRLEAAATDLYSLCLPKAFPCGLEFTKQIYYEKDAIQ